jgi:hypothetical protein
MSVSAALFRLYRLIIVWPLVIAIFVELTGVVLITWAIDLRFSFWIAIFGSMARYWSLVVGIMLVSTSLRQFIANGVTRREFAAGAAVFAAVIAAGFGVLVTLGHWVEGLVVGAIGERNAVYPLLRAGDLLGEFGRVAPQALAWFVSGAVVAAGFYRFGGWAGLLVLPFGLLPASAAEFLVAVDERGIVQDLLPYLPALLISLTLTALAAAAFRLLSRDVAIRRAPG